MNSTPPSLPANASKKPGMPTWAWVLIIVGGVGLTGIAVVGLLAAIAIPNFVRARDAAQKNACVNNLLQIDGAKEQWALENKKEKGAVVDEAQINQYLMRNARPVCPTSGTYVYQPIGTSPRCTVHGNLSQR